MSCLSEEVLPVTPMGLWSTSCSSNGEHKVVMAHSNMGEPCEWWSAPTCYCLGQCDVQTLNQRSPYKNHLPAEPNTIQHAINMIKDSLV